MNTEEKILEALSQMNARMGQVQEDIHRINLRFELDIDKRFDAVDEGISSILEQLTPKSRVDELEADIVVLKAAIRAMSQRISELEKAQ